jgi:hypothetical protein
MRWGLALKLLIQMYLHRDCSSFATVEAVATDVIKLTRVAIVASEIVGRVWRIAQSDLIWFVIGVVLCRSPVQISSEDMFCHVVSTPPCFCQVTRVTGERFLHWKHPVMTGRGGYSL